MRDRFIFCLILFAVCLNGCVKFTQRDYELQEKAYDREQQQREAERDNTFQLKW